MNINKNTCHSFNMVISTNLTQLSSFTCGEALIVNKTEQNLTVWDELPATADRGFLLANNESYIFRGLTDSSQLSASVDSGTGTIYVRTSYYGIDPSR